jgi:hypothetical protein
VLAGQTWPAEAISAILRAGMDAHAGVNPYIEAQMSEDEIAQLVAWLKDPATPPGAYTVDVARQVAILAYEKNGKPATGVDGLLQLIVGWDEFAGRYSHWVSRIEVK